MTTRTVNHVTREDWPPAVSDGLALPCSDCGHLPRFDYHVTEAFWQKWAGADQLNVICLPCMDKRSGGEGLGEALQEVQWTGSGHTVVLRPERRYQYPLLHSEPPA